MAIRDHCSARVKLPIAHFAIPSVLLIALLLCCCALRGQQSPATHRPDNDHGAGSFVDVTLASGIHFQHKAAHSPMRYLIETMGAGVALLDYDNDGRLDLFLVNGADINSSTSSKSAPQKSSSEQWNRLYHQRPNGTFEDVTAKAGLQGVGYGMGVAVGDYDNDGYEDLYVTAFGGNTLYHNNGDGTFTDVTGKAGVRGGGWSTSAAWVDLDNDGLLDLVVLRYLDWNFDDLFCPLSNGKRSYCDPKFFKPVSPLVYHNDGNGHFTEISQRCGIATPGKGLGIAIADYDRDGRIDFYVANDGMAGHLYRNVGAGKFEESGLLANASYDGNGNSFAGMGVDFADYDNDGWPDIMVDDLALQAYVLLRNNGDGVFDYATTRTGIGTLTAGHSGWGLHFIDYDNAGRKDLLIAQGHVNTDVDEEKPGLHYLESPLLLRNTGQSFVDVSKDSGDIFHEAIAGRGLAVGDIDNDGKLDAIIATNNGPAYLLHNETRTSNHWLTLRLVGHVSNRDAIGAVVKVTTSAATQFATVSTASSYLSSSDKRVHFGLGSENLAKEIEIRWPSGIVQKLEKVKADRMVQIDEPPNKPANK
jgi:hypothetical protein